MNIFVDIHSLLQKIVLSRTGSLQAAQDISQDMYFRVLGLANDFPTYDDARNYLIRIASNAAIDYMRTENRRMKLLEGSYSLFEGYSPTPEDSHHLDEQMQGIDMALAQLPEKCRDVLYLSRVEGMTHTEIAARLGVSRSLVEKYAVRALIQCRDYLKINNF